MNESVLYTYFAEELHTHIRLFDKEAQLLKSYTGYTAFKDFHDNFVLSLHTSVLVQPVTEPHFFTVNNLLSYLAVPVKDHLCLIGPVGVCAECITEHQIPSLILPNELISSLHSVDTKRLIGIGVLLYNLYADTPIDTLYCLNHNCTQTDVSKQFMKSATRSVFNHEEYGIRHNPYEAEKREMASIECGNLQSLKECWKENYSKHLGTLSSDHVRQAKYLCIINIALSARAAIRGGLPYELAHSLSDAYCQQIDSLDEKNLSMVESIIRNIQVTYTKLVAQQKGDSADQPTEPPLITRAKNYIFSNLHGKLTVNDVADTLMTHPNYLHKLFKQSQNITVHDYIQREKINLARNMLTYSEYTYSEIGTYLGFSSQSHFGSAFKKFTGMTLKQYRDAYQKI